MAIPIFRPTVKRRNMSNVLACLVSDRIGSGPLNYELASSLGAYLGTQGGFCLASYTDAVHYALGALPLEPLDPVVVSVLAPALYYNELKSKGLVPLVADVDPDSGLLTCSEIEKHLDKKPKAIILYYSLGMVPDLEEMLQFDLPILEDISQGLGGSIENRRCGSYGKISVLSLEPESIVTAGGGGTVLAGGKKMLKRIRNGLEDLIPYGMLPDMNAALGLSQMKDIDKFISSRKEIAEIFTRSLLKSRHRTLLQNENRENINFSFPVLVKDSMKKVRQYAMKNNIETRPAFSGSIIAYLESIEPGSSKASFPNAEKFFRRCLLFPLYPMLGKSNVELISRVLSTLP